MRPSTYTLLDKTGGTTPHERDSSPDTTTIKTLTPPRGCSAFKISVETTNARVTLDGSDPSAASAPSHVYPKDQPPILELLGSDRLVIKWVSTAAAASVVQVTWLR